MNCEWMCWTEDWAPEGEVRGEGVRVEEEQSE